jgi:hypothetical protein
MQMHMTPPRSLIGCENLEKMHLRFRPDKSPISVRRLPLSSTNISGKIIETSQVVSIWRAECRIERLIRGEVDGRSDGLARLVPPALVKRETHRV